MLANLFLIFVSSILLLSGIQACSLQDHTPVLSEGCAKFYRCSSGGVLTIRDCGPGTLFDPKLRKCNHANLVSCPAANSNSTANNATGQVAPVAPAAPANNGTSATNLNVNVRCEDFTPTANCTGYIRCGSNKRSEHACPPGTLFDTNLRTCNHANRVTCNLKQ